MINQTNPDAIGIIGNNIITIKDPYEYKEILSGHFNQLKAKLFNLVEATSSNDTQLNATKGLIRGFCNDHYRNAIEDMRYYAVRNGLIDPKSEEMPEPALPLEQNHLIAPFDR